MLKVGLKRRKTKAQVVADREEAAIREASMNGAQQQQAELKARIQQLEAEQQNNVNATEILNNFLATGVAVQDRDGSIQIPSASKERPKN